MDHDLETALLSPSFSSEHSTYKLRTKVFINIIQRVFPYCCQIKQNRTGYDVDIPFDVGYETYQYADFVLCTSYWRKLTE